MLKQNPRQSLFAGVTSVTLVACLLLAVPVARAQTPPRPATLPTSSEPARVPARAAAPARVPARAAAPPRRAAPAPAVTLPRRAVPARAVTPPRPLAKGPATKKQTGWWRWSYLVDWGIALALGGAAMALDETVEPMKRDIPLDYTWRAMKKETVPSYWLAMAYAVPMVTIGLAQSGGWSGHEFHHASLGLAEAMAVTLLLTAAMKNMFGRLRPDFLARCHPDVSSRCTGDGIEEDLLDGRRSFPSGHASIAFAGGTFMAMYLWGKIGPVKGAGDLWKIPIVLAPIAGAAFIAGSRVVDNRHHWEDVLVGSALGIGVAFLAYGLNFHWPWSDKAGQPRRRGKLQVTPVVGPRTAGLMLGSKF